MKSLLFSGKLFAGKLWGALTELINYIPGKTIFVVVAKARDTSFKGQARETPIQVAVAMHQSYTASRFNPVVAALSRELSHVSLSRDYSFVARSNEEKHALLDSNKQYRSKARQYTVKGTQR